MLEKNVEKYLKDELKKIGIDCLKFISPGYRGAPDRICIGQNMVFFVETKTLTGRLSKLQEVFIKRLAIKEIPVYVVKSKKEVDELVERYKHEVCSERISANSNRQNN